MLITRMRPCTAAAHECTYLGSTHEWTNVLLNAHGTIESLAQFAVKIAYRCICPYWWMHMCECFHYDKVKSPAWASVLTLHACYMFSFGVAVLGQIVYFTFSGHSRGWACSSSGMSVTRWRQMSVAQVVPRCTLDNTHKVERWEANANVANSQCTRACKLHNQGLSTAYHVVLDVAVMWPGYYRLGYGCRTCTVSLLWERSVCTNFSSVWSLVPKWAP